VREPRAASGALRPGSRAKMLTINLSMGFLLGGVVLVALLAHWLRGLARAMLTQQRIDATTSAAEEMAVRVAARFMTKLLAQPDVHAAVTNLIAQGITTWSKSTWPASWAADRAGWGSRARAIALRLRLHCHIKLTLVLASLARACVQSRTPTARPSCTSCLTPRRTPNRREIWASACL
jgi:hypothetical protein